MKPEFSLLWRRVCSVKKKKRQKPRDKHKNSDPVLKNGNVQLGRDIFGLSLAAIYNELIFFFGFYFTKCSKSLKNTFQHVILANWKHYANEYTSNYVVCIM